MPHRKIADHSFIRSNGDFTLTVTSLAGWGLPYESKPRLLLAWLVTETVKTKSQELVLGRSLSDFMRKIGLSATGGKTGSIAPLREQMARLFSGAISATDSTENRGRGKIIPIAEEYDLWWQPKTTDHKRLAFSCRNRNDAQHDMVDKAMTRSGSICEQYGRPGQRLTQGQMIMTRCPEHAPAGARPVAASAR